MKSYFNLSFAILTLFFGTNENIFAQKENAMIRKGNEQYKLKQYADAEANYKRALEVNPESCDALYWRGIFHQKLGRNSGAYGDFKKSINLDPSYFEAYRALDYLLMREQKWNEIIALWTQYLELVPDNPQAYFERSGTYHHNGEGEKALADLSKACELGYEKACALQARL